MTVAAAAKRGAAESGRQRERPPPRPSCVHISGAVRTANLDGCLELQQHRLVHEDLARRGAQAADVRLPQVDLLAWARASDLKQLGYDAVHVERLIR